MVTLTDIEKSTLNRIAESGDELLAKRAVIILHSQAGDAPETIAEKVGFTLRTVNKWRQAFAEKRLDIFPAEVLSVPEPEPVAVVETEPVIEAVVVTDAVEPKPVVVVEAVEVKADKKKGKKKDKTAKKKDKAKKDKKKNKKKDKKGKKGKKKKKG